MRIVATISFKILVLFMLFILCSCSNHEKIKKSSVNIEKESEIVANVESAPAGNPTSVAKDKSVSETECKGIITDFKPGQVFSYKKRLFSLVGDTFVINFKRKPKEKILGVERVILNKKNDMFILYRKQKAKEGRDKYLQRFIKFSSMWTKEFETYKFFMNVDAFSPCGEYAVMARKNFGVDVVETKNLPKYFLGTIGPVDSLGGPFKKFWHGYFQDIHWKLNDVIEYSNGDWNSIYLRKKYINKRRREAFVKCIKGNCTIIDRDGLYFYDEDSSLYSSYHKNFGEELSINKIFGMLFSQYWGGDHDNEKEFDSCISILKQTGGSKRCYKMMLTNLDKKRQIDFEVYGNKNLQDEAFVKCLFGFFLENDSQNEESIEERYSFYFGVDINEPAALDSPCCDPNLGLPDLCNKDKYKMINDWALDEENLVESHP